MKKGKDLKRQERVDLCEELQARSREVYDDWTGKTGSIIEEDFGICNSCKNFCYVKKEFGSIKTWCEIWKCPIVGEEKIIKCLDYGKRGELTLDDMVQMATFIDAKKQKKIGIV